MTPDQSPDRATSSIRIGIWGYGRMGRAVEAEAFRQGIQVAWILGREDLSGVTPERIREADVVIEFTTPDSACDNVVRCLHAGVPVVTGTTGWSERLEEASLLAREKGTAFLHASNFSVGVHLFFAMAHMVTRIMDGQTGYTPSIEEVHHIHKKDAPSGTAITLAETVIKASGGQLKGWRKESAEVLPGDFISIHSIREDEVPGIHTFAFQGQGDAIKLSHTAHNRTGFASGALLAARFLIGKKGVYTMRDVLGLAGWFAR